MTEPYATDPSVWTTGGAWGATGPGPGPGPDPRVLAYYEAAQARADAQAWETRQAGLNRASPADADRQIYGWEGHGIVPPAPTAALRGLQKLGHLYPLQEGGSYNWPELADPGVVNTKSGRFWLTNDGSPYYTSVVTDPATGRPFNVPYGYDTAPLNPLWKDIALSGIDGGRRLGAAVFGAPGNMAALPGQVEAAGLRASDKFFGTRFDTGRGGLPWSLEQHFIPTERDELEGSKALDYTSQTPWGRFANEGTQASAGLLLGDGPLAARLAQAAGTAMKNTMIDYWTPDDRSADAWKLGTDVAMGIPSHLGEARGAGGGAGWRSGYDNYATTGAAAGLASKYLSPEAPLTVQPDGELPTGLTGFSQPARAAGGSLPSLTPEVVVTAHRTPPAQSPSVDRAPADLSWDDFPDAEAIGHGLAAVGAGVQSFAAPPGGGYAHVLDDPSIPRFPAGLGRGVVSPLAGADPYAAPASAGYLDY